MEIRLCSALVLVVVALTVEGKGLRQLARKARSGATCDQAVVSSCAILLSDWVDGDMTVFESEDAFTDFLETKTLRQHCSSLTGIYQCLDIVLKSSSCTGVATDEFTEVWNALGDALNFICVEQLDAIEEHYECFLDDGVDDEATECIENISPHEIGTQCNTTPIKNCFNSAIDNNSDVCKPGAEQLAGAIVDKIVEYIPECNTMKLYRAYLQAQRHLLRF
jgi:hypothetical protein